MKDPSIVEGCASQSLIPWIISRCRSVTCRFHYRLWDSERKKAAPLTISCYSPIVVGPLVLGAALPSSTRPQEKENGTIQIYVVSRSALPVCCCWAQDGTQQYKEPSPLENLLEPLLAGFKQVWLVCKDWRVRVLKEQFTLRFPADVLEVDLSIICTEDSWGRTMIWFHSLISEIGGQIQICGRIEDY